MLYQIQLQWIHKLHETLRSPWADGFFRVWNLVDSLYFTLIGVLLIALLWNRKIAIRFACILFLSLIVNKLLKTLFHLPRPCQIDPSVGLLCSSSFGFPSGAAQTAAIVCGCVFLESRRWLLRGCAVLFALLLCFSRVYLGMHYPTDILGGLVTGSVLVLLYKKLFKNTHHS